MREFLCVNWAFGIKGAIENVVRENFPGELRTWPLIQYFDFEAYHIQEQYLIIILRDKLSGIPAGPGLPLPFPHQEHPPLPPSSENIDLWQSYLKNKFSLKPEDASIIIPIKGQGQNVSKDFELFSKNEREVWSQQIKLIVITQKMHLQKYKENPTISPTNITYNVSGNNSRVNINSVDNSKNIIKQESAEIFSELRKIIELHIENDQEKKDILSLVDDMEKTCGKESFITKYQQFISLAADHVSVFAPLLPALTKLLA